MARKFTYYGSEKYILNQKSILFDGVNEAISLPSLALNSFTTSVWAKSNSVGTSHGICSWTVGTARRDLSLVSGKPAIVYGSLKYRTVTSALTTGLWYHLAATYNGTTPKMYVNGVDTALGSELTAGAGLTNTAYIGRYSFSTPFYFNGNIDEVGIFNSALTAGQITEIYNGGVPNNLLNHSASANLVRYYRMGDANLDTNILIHDIKGGFNGTGINLEMSDIQNNVP